MKCYTVVNGRALMNIQLDKSKRINMSHDHWIQVIGGEKENLRPTKYLPCTERGCTESRLEKNDQMSERKYCMVCGKEWSPWRLYENNNVWERRHPSSGNYISKWGLRNCNIREGFHYDNDSINKHNIKQSLAINSIRYSTEEDNGNGFVVLWYITNGDEIKLNLIESFEILSIIITENKEKHTYVSLLMILERGAKVYASKKINNKSVQYILKIEDNGRLVTTFGSNIHDGIKLLEAKDYL